jgi:alkylation response protein AidB-like acyl-CoA dehydrogenase
MSHPALQQVRELSNTFAQTYPELDRRNAFPHEEIRHLKESGLLGFSIPKEYGGMGASCQDITAAIVILAEGNPAIAQMFLVHCLLGASFIDDFAPESLKRYVFQEILEHHAFLGNAASEKHSKVRYAFEMSLRLPRTIPACGLTARSSFLPARWLET